MAQTYNFVDNTKSFSIIYNNIEYTAAKNDVELVIPDASANNKLEIRSNSAKFTSIKIRLPDDTITGIGAGSTTAVQLRNALEAIFFLDPIEYALGEYISTQVAQMDEDINSDIINVETHHKDKIINVLSINDYSVVLPSLSDVHVNDIFRFKNLNNSNLVGTFVPLSGELIEGSSSFTFFGRGTLSIRKSIGNGIKWSIIEISNLFDHSNQGKTTEVSFENHSGTYSLIHNRGYKPMMQIYVSDGSGGFSEADVDIDHDSGLNSLVVNLEGVNSGYIRYI